jgi:outer membrane protein OmpA-like peptidoglycan-associated protein
MFRHTITVIAAAFFLAITPVQASNNGSGKSSSHSSKSESRSESRSKSSEGSHKSSHSESKPSPGTPSTPSTNTTPTSPSTPSVAPSTTSSSSSGIVPETGGGFWQTIQEWFGINSRVKDPEPVEDKLVPPVIEKAASSPVEPEVILIPFIVEKTVETPVYVGTDRLEVIQTTTLFFATGKTTLTEDGKKSLKALAIRAQRTDNAEVAVASGHADVTGTASKNEILAKGRAEAVKNFLISQGLPETQIKGESFGDRNPEFDTDELNRRVDVTLRGTR